jgi:segregation and condensation protein B
MNTAQKIESILLYKGQPVSYKELAKLLSEEESAIRQAVKELSASYRGRGTAIALNDHECEIVTSSDAAELISSFDKQESETELSNAALETLSIVLYMGPIARSMIDYVRGVNSQFTVRSLLVRGLIEKDPNSKSPKYVATLDTIKFLGLNKTDELPNFAEVKQSITQFVKDTSADAA